MTDHTPSDSPILSMQGVNKTFGSSPALKNVHFELAAREIHGLLGGNGAGKTTLMNILYGLYREDAGEIRLHGEKINIASPKDAIQHRIGMVHQHFLQIKNFSVLENIVLGTRSKGALSNDMDEEENIISKLAKRFSLEVDLHAIIEDLPMGARQKVEILKAIYRGVEILILDEPTTNLTPQEVDDLFHSLREMVNEGMSIVFITHKLREVLTLCDRISVLRNGVNVLTLSRHEASEEAFVRAMVGDEMNIQDSVTFAGRGESTKPLDTAAPVLELIEVKVVSPEGVTLLNNVDLKVHHNEILGIAGVAGNGQHELAEVILSVIPTNSGKVCFEGKPRNGQKTQELLDCGIGYIPEDRLHDGFLPKASVAHNLILGYQHRETYSQKGMINWKRVHDVAEELIKRYNVKTEGPQDVGANLSGGNIQRVMIARALSQACQLLVAHNPTRGLDIPSMDFFYSRILEEKENGMGIMLLSENLDELLLLCDRIAVLYRGEVMGILDRSQFEKYEIGRMMSGVRTVA